MSRSTNTTSTPIVILLGETGCGKSHFISVAGKPKLDPLPVIAHQSDIHSCTNSVKAYEVENNDSASRVQLVDTPGFNNTNGIPDSNIVSDIVKWLEKESNTTIAGILYLQDTNNATTRYKEDITKKFPGTRWITWSSVDQSGNAAGKLNSVTGGYPFDNTKDSAWSIITAAMDSISRGVTRGQLAEALKKISGQTQKKSNNPKKRKFGCLNSDGLS